MSKFCPECFNKLNHSHEKESNLIFSEKVEFCESCGQYRRTDIFYKPLSIQCEDKVRFLYRDDERD